MALHGEASLSADVVAHWFDLRDIWFRVAEREGALVGHVDVTREDDGARFEIDARALDDEAGAALVAEAESYARERAAAGATLRGYADRADESMGATFDRAGYAIVRHFFEMRGELLEAPPPEWPEGIAPRTFRDEDEEAVWECFDEAFADHWDHRPETP